MLKHILLLLLLGCSGDGFTGQSFDKSTSKSDQSEDDQDDGEETEDYDDSSADIPDDVLGAYLVACETVKNEESTGATCQVSDSKSDDLVKEEIKVLSLDIVDQEGTILGRGLDFCDRAHPFIRRQGRDRLK